MFVMADSELDDLLSKSKLIRQRIEARNNQPSTATSPSKSSNSPATQLDLGVKIKPEQNDSFPMLIGHLEETGEESFLEIMMIVITALLALPILPFMFLYFVLQEQRYKREYAQNILNPRYLRGTGLIVASDLSAELITKGKVPRHTFEKEDITCINRHSIQYGMSGSKDYEIRIHLHDFHALTLYGLTGVEPRDIVEKLVSLYSVEVYDTSEYVDTSSGGGGGGG